MTREEMYKYIRGRGEKAISYSQISLFHTCQWQWKLKYVDKVGVFSSGIHLVFGTAMHETLQTYLTQMYNGSIASADLLNLEELLMQEMKNAFIKSAEQTGSTDFATKDDMIDFWEDGSEIIKFFKRRRGDYFTKRGNELLGVEIPIMVTTDANPKVWLVGFIDVGIKDDQEKITLYDLKTSTWGWKDKEKKDKLKSLQLVLYKKYYAKQHNLDPNTIDVQFFILKRKLYNVSDFPQKRVQIHKPACGKIKMKEAEALTSDFVNYVFDDDGQIKPNLEYKKLADHKSSGCKWCDFYKTEHCKF